MKITTKINLLTTAWMLCIMVLINTVVFFSFMTTTVNMEEQIQFQKVDDVLKDFSYIQSAGNIEAELKEYLTLHSYIRMIGPGNTVLHEATDDPILSSKIKGKYTLKRQSETHIIETDHGEEEVLVVHAPITKGSKLIGSLEIGERLTGLEARKELLRAILIFCTILAAILSWLGGKSLANFIMRPISRIIKTMEEIETSGAPKTILIKNKTNDELQKLARTFNRMIHRLQSNMEKQKQFVSDASHELKTPLTVIKSYASFLRRHGLEDKEMAEEAIQAIHSEATRIQKMTETFLDLATLEKETEIEVSKVNLVALCQTIVKQLKVVHKRELLLHFSENPMFINADELKLKQVIIILMDNAIKYSHEKIDVFLEKNDGKTIISVKDYGIGIPEEEIESTFERFYRVDKARSRETGGTGLGLYIAKSIMKLHKGEIQIESKEGVGTTVKLIFPAMV